MGKVSVLGIDLAKSSFQLHGNDERGKRLLSKTLRRNQLELAVANIAPCVVALEACGSAHYWARRFETYGHTVRLISPQFVAPFVKGNKNDKADAEAIAEAASRPSMHFVPIKSQEHLDLQAVHRVRDRLVGHRTALTNEMRGILFEQGIAVAQGIATLKTFVTSLLRGETKEVVSPMCRETIADLADELAELEERITTCEGRLERFAAENETCKKLLTIPGVGLITATAMVASVPDPGAFKNGRQLAAWVGLVPGHTGTGGADKNRLGRITKRGDAYLRKILVHGARAALRTIDKRTDRYGEWAKELKAKKGWNKTAIAMANKNARIIWSVMTSGAQFNGNHMPQRA